MKAISSIRRWQLPASVAAGFVLIPGTLLLQGFLSLPFHARALLSKYQHVQVSDVFGGALGLTMIAFLVTARVAVVYSMVMSLVGFWSTHSQVSRLSASIRVVIFLVIGIILGLLLPLVRYLKPAPWDVPWPAMATAGGLSGIALFFLWNSRLWNGESVNI